MSLSKIFVNNTQIVGVDDEPTAGSNNLVKSDGVYDNTKELFENAEETGWTDGYYISNVGVITANGSWSISEKLSVQKGDNILFTSVASNQSRVAMYNASDECIGILYSGPASALLIYICSPTVSYVRASAQKSDTTKSLALVNQKTYDKTQQKIGGMIDEIYDDLSIGAVPNAYINGFGNVIERAGASYKEFQVFKGTTIEIQIGDNRGNVSFISKKLSDGSNKYQPLVTQTQAPSFPYTYTCNEDMIVAVCNFGASSGIRFKITTDYSRSAVLSLNEIKAQNALNDKYAIELGYMFDNIAVIGDSMSVGTIATDPNDKHDNFGTSWLFFLAKRWNCKSRFHYANGGTSTRSWLNDANNYGLGVMLADSKVYNAYFIAYGHNDNMAVGDVSDEAATVTVIEGVPSCPDNLTFCAYYKAIINQIRSKAPHAMIFCMSEYDGLMTGSGKAAYRQAVIDVAEQYYNNGDQLVHHLETGGVPDSNMELGSHYSTVGYAYIAQRTDEVVKKLMYEKMSDTEIKFFGGYNGNNVR